MTTRHLTRQPGLARDLRRASLVVIPAAVVLAVLLAVTSRPISIPGHAAAGEAVITITSHAQVHVTGHGGCYVRAPQRYDVTLLGGGIREGALGPGRLVGDTCEFRATLPALPGATEIVVNGGEHTVSAGAGAIMLSSDDGHWVPLRSGDL